MCKRKKDLFKTPEKDFQNLDSVPKYLCWTRWFIVDMYARTTGKHELKRQSY